MLFKKLFALILTAILALSLCACGTAGGAGNAGNTGESGNGSGSTETPSTGGADDNGGSTDDSDKTDDDDVSEHDFVLVAEDGGTYTYKCSDCEKEAIFTVSYESGTEYAYSVSGSALTFNGITEESCYSVSGEFYGNIVIDAGDDYEFELVFNGFTLTSYSECPLYIASGDKVTVSAKKNTENYIYDMRSEVTDEDEVSSAVYALCDLNVQGKGTLSVKSANNNGIHTKDDLKVKNLTLNVTCKDNALKGNDSVTIESGVITLIATEGDGIKTTNSDVSSKGNQRGIVEISGGTVVIYASRDGIDAAYDVIISEDNAEVCINIYTDKYSEYSEESASNSSSSSKTSAQAAFPGNSGGRPGGNPGENPGGGQGGMNDGNSDKGDYSTKGIKATNRISVTAGTIFIKSYDDCLHANSGETLENGETSVGNVTVSGGTLTLYSDDDAIHADGKATISGGIVTVTGCYEGIEGETVEISGGKISVVSSDDGVNGTGTSGASITVSGGELYVYAGGDGLDSNSTTRYGGIVFSGGRAVIISYGQADSAIDTENGYAYTGGYILAIGISGGMSGETVNANNFNSVGKSENITLKAGVYLSAGDYITVRMPQAMNARAVFLGDSGVSFGTSNSSSLTFDDNGVCFNK